MLLHPASVPGTRQEFSWFLSSQRLLLLCLVTLVSVVHAELPAPDSTEVELGRRIYMEGVSASGAPLQGNRANSGQIEGAAAACETCHRRSGMGSLEGNVVVTPITGNFLFATEENRPIALVDQRAPKNISRAHAPYTEASLAKAIREGINVSGRKLSPLMPQYALTDVEIKAVAAYLKRLSAKLSPGVGEDTLHFATIVTPGVDPKAREVMVNMMRAAFSQRNATQENYSGRMRMPIDLIPRTLRNWQLSVWELQGAPETWGAQLAEKYRQEPVFAVISGLSNGSWTPVHNFCQQEKLPCLLPNVTSPPAETAFYSLYYSRGVALEADVLARHLRNQEKKAPQRVLQIYRDDELGKGAAEALTKSLHDSGIQVENRVLQGQDPSGLKQALKGVSSKDAVMLWLNPTDLAALKKAAPKQVPAIAYVSGFLAEESYSVVPKKWNAHTRVVYPYELGEKRQKNAQSLKKWLQTWNLPLVNEALQTEVFFNLLFLTDLTSQMLDNLYRDYMIERAEDMLSLGSNVSAYPHLSMARGQRFASKGAYIARLAKDGKLVADSEWIVP
ncbi:MAG: ABC transporter substrate-binding protein [Methylococcaceae bacterium]|nr:ABC transporter substrate-binding protein [Methylococcaceae bacterium]